jgi:hypothetical protein
MEISCHYRNPLYINIVMLLNETFYALSGAGAVISHTYSLSSFLVSLVEVKNPRSKNVVLIAPYKGV